MQLDLIIVGAGAAGLAAALRAGKNGVRALLLECSDGSTSDFAKSGGSASIIANGSWEEDIEARRLGEGRHRGLLLQTACALLQLTGCSASMRMNV